MSLSARTISPNQAAHYYHNEDHNQQFGQWFGRGAHALELHGHINVKDFRDVLHGHSPTRLFRIRQQRKSHLNKNAFQRQIHTVQRGATDMTFSAPKSVSITALVHQDTRVIAAHQQAVISLLTTIEAQHLRVREMVHGTRTPVHTDKMIAATFLHNTSRNLDPQLHTHALIMNATMDSRGRWKSMVNTEYFTRQPELGKEYRQELAANLQDIGYKPVWDDQEQFFEIDGVHPALISAFSTRRAEVLKAAKGSSIKMRTAAALATRKAKIKVVNEDMLVEGWQQKAQDIVGQLRGVQPKAVVSVTPQQRKKKKFIPPIANPQIRKGPRR